MFWGQLSRERAHRRLGHRRPPLSVDPSNGRMERLKTFVPNRARRVPALARSQTQGREHREACAAETGATAARELSRDWLAVVVVSDPEPRPGLPSAPPSPPPPERW